MKCKAAWYARTPRVRRSLPARFGLSSSHCAAWTKSEDNPDSTSIRLLPPSETGRAATDRKAALQLKTANWMRAAIEITRMNAEVIMDPLCDLQLLGAIDRSY